MEKQEYPKFIKNTPHGIDKYEGKSAERVANAIANHIIDSSKISELTNIIGLEGEWGAGKSNVVRILKNKLGNNYIMFEYDAWGHQEDLQRRSFLETLTLFLIDEEGVISKQTQVTSKGGGRKISSWNDKLKYLLAKKVETETTSYPKISLGIATSFLTAVLTPIFVFIAFATKSNEDSILSTILSITISAAPVIIALLLWAYYAKKEPEKYRNLHFLLTVYQDKVVEGVEYETISENEPSVTEFKEWMSDLSNALTKKLVIVYDNMDRLPADKVKELWSSIHTFFSENGYNNIWVIIPFDKSHLANAFGESNHNLQVDLTCHFIKKTFPVIYRVAPPVLTDWKKAFSEYFIEAFGNDEYIDNLTIVRIFSVSIEHITPREIIAFINEIVSLKRTWQDEIPLLYIAIYSLKKDIIINTPVNNILSGSYLGSIEKIIPNNEELQKYISALTYGIDIKLAEQIPLKQYLQKTLKGERTYDINKYIDNTHFVSILDDEIKELDPALTESAILSLSKLNKQKGINIVLQWNELVKHHLQLDISTLTFKDSYKDLLLNADIHHKIIFSKYLYSGFLNQKNFSGSQFFSAMEEFENFITSNKLGINLENLIVDKKVDPLIFIDYANKAKEKYGMFKLVCDNYELNFYLINLINMGLPSMNFIEHLSVDISYSFEAFLINIETTISEDNFSAENFNELLKAYKAISKTKPLSTQFTPTQILAMNNTINEGNMESYYDVIAMGLSKKIIDIPYTEGIDDKIADVIEYYQSFTNLLLLAKDWNSILLRKTVYKMICNSIGEDLDLIEVLPFFEEIKVATNVSPDVFLNELCLWDKSITDITINNIDTIIPRFDFYNYSSTTKNPLTTHINTIAVQKLSTISETVLLAQVNSPNFYWLNVPYILIKNNVLRTLPDNLTSFCKLLLLNIGSGMHSIPIEGSIIDIIINKANKSKLQPTIKRICDEYCNKTKVITPELFVYFVKNFDFLLKMKNRADDITRNILNDVITNQMCQSLILENSQKYADMINEADNDAEDLKLKIGQLLLNKPSEKLIAFASLINVSVDIKVDN